ncbi:MAG: hypothetical protein ACLVBP_04335 [Ruminococcus sp.]
MVGRQYAGFREVYEVTGEELYKNWTIELSRGIIKAGAPERLLGLLELPVPVLPGTAGILEHFAEMYEYTGEKFA